MSNTPHPDGPSNATRISAMPRAMIHKQILDAATAQPTATLDTLAAEVMGASVGLVERVLEEYGDPAAPAHATDGSGETLGDQHESAPQSTDEPMTEPDAHHTPTAESEPAPTTEGESTTDPGPALSELTEKQQTTLRAIYEHPDATQRELAELLDVSGSAISLRVNNVDDFEWEHRQEFVTSLFDQETMSQNTTEPSQHAVQDLTERMESISQQIETLEHQLDEQNAPSQSVFADPELAHKIAHACLSSEVITEDEELHILKGLITQESAGSV